MTMKSLEPITTLQYLALINEVSYVNVCKEIGITPQQFSDWVKRRRPVPKERLNSLAEYFGIEKKLLIDENNYLYDLTPEVKFNIQILFLQRKLDLVEEENEKQMLREKLDFLYNEKICYTLIGRFENIVRHNKERTHRICEAFLKHVEQGNLTLVEEILNQKEPKK